MDSRLDGMPAVMNRVVFQCEEGHPGDEKWQAVVGIDGRTRRSVQVKCDVCGYSVRLRGDDLLSLTMLGTRGGSPMEDSFIDAGLVGWGRFDERPDVAYCIVKLKAAKRLAEWVHARVRESTAESDYDGE